MRQWGMAPTTEVGTNDVFHDKIESNPRPFLMVEMKADFNISLSGSGTVSIMMASRNRTEGLPVRSSAVGLSGCVFSAAGIPRRSETPSGTADITAQSGGEGIGEVAAL
jgi:hypothetical protein